MNVICAFSSDRRELYKADIYRVLALPEGHITHFRYKAEYVDENLLRNHSTLEGQKVVIFFTHGNKLNKKDNDYTHVSVRQAVITHIERSDETDVYHVYLKLKDFCNISINSDNDNTQQVPNKFFTRLNCTEHRENNRWFDRVNAIKSYFPHMTFFHMKEIRSRWCRQQLNYQNDEKTCHYDLTHGRRYSIRMAVANPYASDSKIEISDSSEELTINCINPLETSIQFDDYDVPVSVKTLDILKQASLLQFKPTKKEGDNYKELGEYATNIELNLKLSIKRPVFFGFFSTLAFWALLLVKPVSKTAVLPSNSDLFWSTIFFFIASSSLFYWFNKK